MALTISSIETVCSYHVYKDISELPCSPEQIFAKIIMPHNHCQIWTVTRLFLLFQGGERPAYTASLAALVEVEGSVWDYGPSGFGNHLKYYKMHSCCTDNVIT